MRFEIILNEKELKQLKREQLEKQNKRKRAIKKQYIAITKKIDLNKDYIKRDRERLDELSFYLDFESAMARNELIEDIYYLEECINELYNDLELIKKGLIYYGK